MDTGDVARRCNLPRDGNWRRQAALQEALRTTPLLLRDHPSRLLHGCQSEWVYCVDVLTRSAIRSFYKTHEFRHREDSSLEDVRQSIPENSRVSQDRRGRYTASVCWLQCSGCSQWLRLHLRYAVVDRRSAVRSTGEN